MSYPLDSSPHTHSPRESEQTAPGGGEVAAKPQAPRLGILHLMLWMAGSAVILAVWRAIDTVSEDEPATYRIFHQVMLALESMLYGMAIGGLALIFMYRRQKLPYPYEPGHWLLMISGVMIIVTIGSEGALRLLNQEPSIDVDSTAFVVHMLSLVGQSWLRAILAVVAAIALRKSVTWLVAFCVMAAADSLDGLSNLFQLVLFRIETFDISFYFVDSLEMVNIACWSIAGLAVAIAACVDLSQRNRRDWAHWTGVFVFTVGLVVVWAWIIGIWVIFDFNATNYLAA